MESQYPSSMGLESYQSDAVETIDNKTPEFDKTSTVEIDETSVVKEGLRHITQEAEHSLAETTELFTEKNLELRHEVQDDSSSLPATSVKEVLSNLKIIQQTTNPGLDQIVQKTTPISNLDSQKTKSPPAESINTNVQPTYTNKQAIIIGFVSAIIVIIGFIFLQNIN